MLLNSKVFEKQLDTKIARWIDYQYHHHRHYHEQQEQRTAVVKISNLAFTFALLFLDSQRGGENKTGVWVL